MKNLLIVLLAALALFSCKQGGRENENKTNLVVSGQITNAGGKLLFLEQMFPDGITKLDSVVVGNDNSFSFRLNLESAGFYLLRIDKDNAIYLIMKPGDSIQISGDFGKLAANYKVNGSKDSEIARELNLHMIESASKLEEFNKIYQAALQNQNIKIEDVLKELDEKALKLYELDKLFLTDFIHKYESSPVIFLALFQQLGGTRILTPDRDIAVYEFTLEMLKKHHPKLAQTASLEKQLNDYKVKSQPTQGGVSVGGEAPDITLPGPDGKTHSLHDLRGKYVLLDFWASWCKPCRAESPFLVKAYNKYSSKGFTIFQVSLDSDKGQWEQAIKNDNLTWTHVSDLKYWDCVPAKVYGVAGIPANFLLDANGVIIATNLRGEALEKKLAELLK
ncbi:MAG TPA: TlpA disulfide reductase family protein [Bacteroidales bacterium]|nr:TlpA disulfide reductase family protein [Bacteroidales bacterium]